MASNISQRARALAKLYNETMKTNDPKEHVAEVDYIFLKGSLGITYDAKFFSYREGKCLQNPRIQGYFTTSIESHMPHFVLYISNEVEAEALRRATRSGIVPNPDMDEPPLGKEAKEWREILKDAPARATKVKAYIGFEALKKHRYAPIPDLDEFIRHNKTLASHFSDAMKDEVLRILRTGGYPNYYEVAFSLYAVAQDKLFLGCPEWAENFAQAIRDEVICCIIDGSKETARRIYFLGEMMDDAKTYGSRVHQLWLNDPNPRRLIIHPSLIRTKPNSPVITNEVYGYHPMLPNYCWEEAAIKMAVTIMQKHALATTQKTDFEKEKLSIVFFKVQGTNDGVLLGFVDRPQDDYAILTPGTELRMTFVEDEKGDPSAEDDPGKENGSNTSDGDSGTEEKDLDETAKVQEEAAEIQDLSGIPPEVAATLALFKEDFPHGAIPLDASEKGLLDGLYALCLSFEMQYENSPPTVTDLQNVIDSQAYQSTLRTKPANENDFSAEQLMIIIDMWAMTVHGFHIQLGVLQDGTVSLLPTDQSDAERLWVRCSNERWEGLEPMTAETEADLPAEDPDIDKKFLEKAQQDEITKSFAWRCRITPPVPNCPANKIPVFVYKSWDEESKQFDRRPLHVVDSGMDAEYDFRNLIKGATSYKVQFQVTESLQQSKMNLAALERLNYAPEDRPYTPHNRVWRQLLTCNNLHLLEPQDAFADIRDEFPEPEKLMILNKEQKKGIIAAGQAPGGIILLNGVPGSGKSHFLCQTIRPFLMSEKHLPILMVATSNEAADNLIRTAWQTYRDLVRSGQAAPGKRFIRLYSNTSEKMIRSRHIKAAMEKDPSARPDIEDISLVELSDIDAVIRHLFDTSRARKYKGIFDRRVNDIEFALGEALLQETGLVNDPIYTPANAEAEYQDFRMQFRNYHLTKEMNKDQRKEYALRERGIMLDILENASIVVCTVYMAGSEIVASSVGMKAVGVILDEAHHDEILNMLPLASARMPQRKFTILSGDKNQVAPPQMLNVKEAPFATEMNLPLPTRLQLLGFPCVELFEQSRMVPEISIIVNRLVYGGKITNVFTHCGLRAREYARAFRGFAKDTWKGPAQNVVWLDIQGKMAQTAKAGTSKMNQYFAITALNLIPKLFRLGTEVSIALITPYAGQRNIYVAAKASMQLDPYMSQFDLSNLYVGTIDSVIGKEFTYVILDLPIDDSVGFLSDIRRLNVGLSRAQDGLIVLLNGREVDELLNRSSFNLKNLTKLLNSHRVEVSSGTAFPNCRWFTPSDDLF